MRSRTATHRAIPGVLALVLVLSLAVLASLCSLTGCAQQNAAQEITVGFIYDNDETTPYSYNFFLAQKAVHDAYQNRAKVIMYSNVFEDEIDEPVHKLADARCDIIFTNCYGNLRELAAEYPDIEFCQVSNDPYPEEEARPNYHTFKGEVYQGRYASGVAAGLKLQEMIDAGKITPEEALVGFVAAFPYPEVISGFSAFILGVRSVVPQATLHVKYTETWSSYVLEKACATELLDEGCVIISQHTDTVAPAMACEECYSREVYHVAYNIDMTDVAPNTSLVGARINWTPYVIEAVDAVARGESIEETVAGTVHPLNDMSAGIRDSWVELTPMNDKLMSVSAQERVNETMQALSNGTCQVFVGDYRGVNPNDPSDVVDLREGFHENADSSIPSFHYLLQDVVTVEE